MKNKFAVFLYFAVVISVIACSNNKAQESSSSTIDIENIHSPLFVTTSEDNYWNISTAEPTSLPADITADTSTTYQHWSGFGGTFNEAGWDALLALSANDKEQAIKLLFHQNQGAGFTHARIPIGSSDYALNRYSLAEVPNDFEMKHFSIERDQQYLIPYIKSALSINPNIYFWASPWAPPTWMMDINLEEKYPNDSGTMKSDSKSLSAHALYMAKFVEAYRQEGINIQSVQPQNEPGYAQHYPSCAWPDDLMRNYIAGYLGPLFAKRLPDTEIWLGTMSNPISDSIVQSVMNSPEAAQYIKGIGLQWGMQKKAKSYVERFPIPIMQTEHRCGNYPWVNKNQSKDELAPNDYGYALESWQLIKDWIVSGVNSYYAWNMVLDKSGMNLDEVRIWHQNALLVVDRENKELIITPSYYVLRHLSQFVKPNATRIEINDPDALAFKNMDGSVVAVIHNADTQVKSTIVDLGGKKFNVKVPAKGWLTAFAPQTYLNTN